MKKTKLLPVIFITAALTACNSSNAPGDRGNYDEPESTPTPTAAEEPEATPTPAEVPEETPTPTEAEEEIETSPFMLWQYVGYVDEAEGYTWQEEFIDRDFDGDGTKDRVYREWFEEEQTAKYTIEFGNGRELIVSGGWETGFPHVQAGDLTGNGEPEILFTLSYDTSTDPMSFGEMWVFEYDKDSNSYKEMSLPLVNGDEGNGQRDEHRLVVTTVEVVSGNDSNCDGGQDESDYHVLGIVDDTLGYGDIPDLFTSQQSHADHSHSVTPVESDRVSLWNTGSSIPFFFCAR